jgi:hypothetical protein
LGAGCQPRNDTDLTVVNGPDPLVARTNPYATDRSMWQKQENSGYYPAADAPLTRPNPAAR